MAAVNDEKILCDTQAIGNSGVTQIQYRATEGYVFYTCNMCSGPMLHEKADFCICNVFIGMAIDVQHYASQVGSDDESDWLHRNDAYQMQAKTRRNYTCSLLPNPIL